jgi:Bacterial regulatory proteins, tetR family
VHQAEQELEQRGIPFTVKALAEQAQVSYSVLYYHTRVHAIVRQIVHNHRGEHLETDNP